MSNRLDGKSLDLEQINIQKLKSVFPDCVTLEPAGTYKVDLNKLLSLLGNYNDDDFEKYSFTWSGKANCLRLAQKRSTATLRPCPDESVDFDNTQNLYIEGDNLEVLKLLQKSYFGKVKMIYIDPPYNTGNDFVYEDDFKDPLEKYKQATNQENKSNAETAGRYHTNWLNMMYPRLRLAANLLREDGVIFISIDDNEQANLKKVCDEVFGEENFVAKLNIITGANQAGEGVLIQKNVEYCLVYAKHINSVVLNKVDKTEETWRNLNDAPTPLSTRLDMGYTLYYNPSSNEIIPEMDYNKSLVSTNDVSVVYKDDLKLIEKGFIPVRPGLRNGILHRWRWGIETFQERIHEIKMFPNGNGFTPKFKQTGLNPPKNICNFTGGANDLKHLFGKSLFSYPKSISFIRYLVSIGCNKDSVVLDFFSGSATTAHAVMQINAEDGGQRKFIMVQLPALCDEKSEAFKAGYKNICEIGKERIRRAGKQINEELIQNGKTLVDVGFKVLKLDSSNIITWDDSLTNNINDLKERLSKQILNLKGDRTETDLIYEILLKMGFGLTTKINLENINNKTVCSVKENGVNMLICLDQGIVPEDIEQMAELEPNAVVISEGSFVDNSTLSNALYIFKNHDIELKLI